MIDLMVGLAGWQVLAVVAGVGLVEGTGVLGYVVPGLLTLLTAGTLSSAGVVSLPLLLGVAVASAVVGDSAGYWLGRLAGPRLEASRPVRLIGEERWERGRSFLRRHGFWAVAAGRWFGPVRAVVPLLAGGSGMSYDRFLRANVLGVVSYATTAILLGYGAASAVAVGAGLARTVWPAAPYAAAPYAAILLCCAVVGWVVVRGTARRGLIR